jgi:hypothetical protein
MSALDALDHGCGVKASVVNDESGFPGSGIRRAISNP